MNEGKKVKAAVGRGPSELGTEAGNGKERVYRAGFEPGSPREKQAHSLARFDFKKIRRLIQRFVRPPPREPARRPRQD